jgi:hypothetical protein
LGVQGGRSMPTLFVFFLIFILSSYFNYAFPFPIPTIAFGLDASKICLQTNAILEISKELATISVN